MPSLKSSPDIFAGLADLYPRDRLYTEAGKLSAYESDGLTAFTVPAQVTRPLTKLPWFMAREVAAFWLYYLRGIVPLAT